MDTINKVKKNIQCPITFLTTWKKNNVKMKTKTQKTQLLN